MVIIDNRNNFSLDIDIDEAPINIKGENHFQLIRGLLREFKSAIFISPFLFDDFNILFENSITPKHAIELITSCAPRGDDQFRKPHALNSFAKCMQQKTGSWPVISIDQNLHSKIYIFSKDGIPRVGVVTSANLTLSGLIYNNETGIALQDTEILNKIIRSAKSQLDYINITDYQIDLMLSVVQTITRLRKNDTLQDEEIGLSNILNNNCTPSHGNTSITLKNDAKFYIKVSGEQEAPILPKDKEQFNDPQTELTFAKPPMNINQGDCLLEVAVGGACFLSYYCCASGVFERTAVEKKASKAHTRWPFYMHCNNLSISYGGNWFDDPLYYDKVIEEFLKKNPSSSVTPSGKKHIKGAIQFSNSYFEVTKEFGGFVREKIDSHYLNKRRS